MTLIEPTTFRPIARCLTQQPHRVPSQLNTLHNYKRGWEQFSITLFLSFSVFSILLVLFGFPVRFTNYCSSFDSTFPTAHNSFDNMKASVQLRFLSKRFYCFNIVRTVHYAKFNLSDQRYKHCM